MIIVQKLNWIIFHLSHIGRKSIYLETIKSIMVFFFFVKGELKWPIAKKKKELNFEMHPQLINKDCK
jgi:hypothetical protein